MRELIPQSMQFTTGICVVAVLCSVRNTHAQPGKPVPLKPQLTQQVEIQNHMPNMAQQAKMNTLPCAVSGTVRDAQGAPVPNATVQVIETATGARHAVTADNAGNYCAAGLPAGKYSVTFTKVGLRNTRIDALTIAVDRTATVNAVLPAAPPVPKPEEAEKIVAPSLPSPVAASDPVAPPPPPQPIPNGSTSTGQYTGGQAPGGQGPGSQAPGRQDPANPAPADPAAALGAAEAKWFSQLPNGSIIYNVPAQMTIGKPSTVTVTIQGYKAPAPQSGGNAPATLKVSEWMRVEATQPDNPEEFTISSDPSQNPQFVPIDSGATWTWTVTPNHLGNDQKLQFQAFVLYKDDTSKVQRALPSAEKIVTVQAEGVTGILGQIDDNFWTNPLNWFKYMLPGGAGFAALVALVSWWLKNRKKSDPAKPQG